LRDGESVGEGQRVGECHRAPGHQDMAVLVGEEMLLRAAGDL
jgi:hypothetical protein